MTTVQTPLVRLFVNLLWIFCTTSCTTFHNVVDWLWICRKVVDLLRICCGFVVQLFDLLWTSRKPYSTVSICCGFAVESPTNPQHLDMSRCCGFVVDLSKSCGFVVDSLWICCTSGV
jgi:hypothetical protein